VVASRIEVNPKIMMGKPVIKGTRITVEIILRKLSQGYSPKDVIAEYPDISEEDINAALEYAASAINNEEIHFVSKGR
jgi:uncharacterized protein (DUF433 family)